MRANQFPPLVAVVEDDAMSRAAIGRLLRTGGFEPALFDSAEVFLASPLKRAAHCVIVDVHLAGMSGLDLQDKLRAAPSLRCPSDLTPKTSVR